MTSSVFTILLLVGLSSSLPSTLIEPSTNRMVHDMMDAIESGMNDPVEDGEGKGRNFWLVSVTLTSTSTVIETATTTTTITPSCVDGMFMECTETPTTMPPTTTAIPTTTGTSVPRRKNKNKKNKNKKNKNKRKPDSRSEFMDLISDIYQGAVVTDQYGEEADISVLFPGQIMEARSTLTDVDEYFMRNDDPNLQSGQLSWKEMAVEGLEETPCSRKSHGHGNPKRPRIITIDNVVETVTYTSTSTIEETAIATATFSVSLASCTPAGFEFPIPLCTDLPTTGAPTTTGAPRY